MKLFIFGSTGDLVKRKVLPALAALRKDDLQIIPLGRKDFTDESYRAFAGVEGETIAYQKVDFDALEISDRLLSKEEINYFYVALPPKNFKGILQFLGKLQGFGYHVAACFEKPFGGSLKEAQELKQIIEDEHLTDAIYLSDHYLFKDEIINLSVTDFKKLKLVLLETVGLEGRVGYYDEVGALKDIVQSHFLNIVFKLQQNGDEEFKDFEIAKFERRQYRGYIEELGKPSETETYVHLVLRTSSREFEFETGKKFEERISYLELDNKRIDLASAKNSYEYLFADFLEGKRGRFPTIGNAILAWQIIEKIEAVKPPVVVN